MGLRNCNSTISKHNHSTMQIRTLLLQIFISCLLISCKPKTEQTEISSVSSETHKLISDSTAYSVVKYLFEHKSSNPFLKYDKVVESAGMPFFFTFKGDSLQIVNSDSIFSSTDIEYMQAQKTQFYRFRLNQSKFDNKTIISKDSLKLTKNRSYCFISFPVFNLRHDKFMIWNGYYCGAFCSESATFIYQKNGDDWKIIKVLNQTVS